MPNGFGSDSLGSGPFGSSDWAKKSLYDLMPEFQRDKDLVNEGILLNLSEASQGAFDVVKNKIEKYDELKDPFLTRTAYSEVKRYRLGKKIEQEGDVLQRGIDAMVTSGGEFTTPRGRFTIGDIGRTITISRSLPVNNKKVTIVAIINKKTVITNPGLTATAGVFRWELRERVDLIDENPVFEVRSGDVFGLGSDWDVKDGFQTLKLYNRQSFDNLLEYSSTKSIEQSGADGSIDSEGRFSSPSLILEYKDIGRLLSFSGSIVDDNNNRFEISQIDKLSATNTKAVISRRYVPGLDINGGLLYVALPGNNTILIEHVVSGMNTALSVNVEDNLVTINLETDNAGLPLSTANQIITAIGSNIDAPSLISVTATGTGNGISASYTNDNYLIARLTPDNSGTISWALLPIPRIQFTTPTFPKGIVEQEGFDISISGNVLTSLSANFSTSDIGKYITLRSQISTNNIIVEIIGFSTKNIITINKTLTTDSNVGWELRTVSKIGDGTQIEISAPSIITFLAEEFGISIDNQETEVRQRTFVGNVNQWLDKKGSSEAYRILGRISGYNVTSTALFRISRDLALGTLSSQNIIEVGETTIGRFGTDGSILYESSGEFIFFSSSAKFKFEDTNSLLRISNALISSNNSLFTIVEYVNENTIILKYTEDPQQDPSNGNLSWLLEKVYITQAPALPNYDEINSDLMTTILGEDAFSVDRFCFEDGVIDQISVTIDTNSANTKFLSANVVQITASGQFGVVSYIGNWYIEDDDGTRFYLETPPTETFIGSGIYTMTTFATVLPTTGGFLGYECPINAFCYYCASSKVFLVIEAEDILNDPLSALENGFKRVTQRMELAKPKHVEFVIQQAQALEASFNMTAEIMPNIIGETMVAFFSGYYDEIPADVIPTDIGLQVEIETP